MKKVHVYFFGLLIIVLVVTASLLLLNNARQKQNKTEITEKTTSTPSVAKLIDDTQNVSLSAMGFGPKIINIKPGTRVLWANRSGLKASVNSDPYPTNSNWSFLNLGVFDNGQSLSVIFEKSGTYTYHNQLNPNQTGIVIVK
jgi:plastocyanin